MNRTLLATGHFTWDAVERRSDRYGSVRLSDDKDKDVLLNPSLDVLEGKQGRLVAEVLVPVRSPHMGDLARGFKPSMPDKGEIVVLGEGSLFIEHRGRAIHERAAYERHDDKMLQALEQAFARMAGNNVRISRSGRANERAEPAPEVYDVVGFVRISRSGRANERAEPSPEVYDVVGLKPDDEREHDWLDPRSFYRLHLSKINLYFEEL